MDSTKLTFGQLSIHNHEYAQACRRLRKMREAMDHEPFPLDEPIFAAVCKATDALSRACEITHRRMSELRPSERRTAYGARHRDFREFGD